MRIKYQNLMSAFCKFSLLLVELTRRNFSENLLIDYLSLFELQEVKKLQNVITDEYRFSFCFEFTNEKIFLLNYFINIVISII